MQEMMHQYVKDQVIHFLDQTNPMRQVCFGQAVAMEFLQIFQVYTLCILQDQVIFRQDLLL